MLNRYIAITVLTLAALAFANCKKKGGSSGGASTKRVDTWLPKKLKKTSGTVAGLNFTIMLPEGLKIHKTPVSANRWIPKTGDQFDYPQFDVSTSVWKHPTSPEDAAKQHKSNKMNRKDVILKSTSAAGGILLVYKSHTNKAVYAKLFRTKGDKKLVAQCTWIRPHNEEGPVPKMDKVAAWLEKICLTFEVK